MKRAEADEKEDGDKQNASFHQSRQHALIAVANTLKAPLEAALESSEDAPRRDGAVVVRLQQVHRHGRHQGSREDVGREHGEDDRFGQRNEEITRDAAEEEHRQKDDADAERGHERRYGDLRGAFEDGFV